MDNATKGDFEGLLDDIATKADIKQLETKMVGHLETAYKSLNDFCKHKFMNESEISKNWTSRSNWKL